MNLAIRGSDGQIADGDTFHNDRHPDLEADFVLATPPLNQSNRKHGHDLTPGRYVGAEEQPEDDEPFEEKLKRLVATLREQREEAARLDAVIPRNLEGLGFGS